MAKAAPVSLEIPDSASHSQFLSAATPTVASYTDRTNTLFVTSEIADLIKVGGLGDVSANLPRALRNRHDVRVLVPGYSQIMTSGRTIRMVGKVPARGALPACRIGCIELDDGLPVYVMICPELYERDGFPYGDADGVDWKDNYLRFALLGHVACEIAARRASLGWSPQLIHANDWPAGLAPAYIRWRQVQVPTLFTVHNLQYQGIFPEIGPADLGLRAGSDLEPISVDGAVCYLKAALVYSDHITTVSNAYAREITTPEGGCGLHQLLQAKAARNALTGIVNGISDTWQPYKDTHLLPFPNEWESSGKYVHARYLEERFGLQPSSGPIFAIVSRIVHQKGIDLSIAVTDTIVAAGGRLVVIGRGEPALERALLALQARYPGKVGVIAGFDEQEARRMFAGADFLLMPSRFEPCGLSQLYAQRLGCLPIAHRTGGLIDTVVEGVTGFLFNECNLAAYAAAVQRAVSVYNQRDLLRDMRYQAMAAPRYWADAVRPYDQLYNRLTATDTHGKAAAS